MLSRKIACLCFTFHQTPHSKVKGLIVILEFFEETTNLPQVISRYSSSLQFFFFFFFWFFQIFFCSHILESEKFLLHFFCSVRYCKCHCCLWRVGRNIQHYIVLNLQQICIGINQKVAIHNCSSIFLILITTFPCQSFFFVLRLLTHHNFLPKFS